MKLYATLAILCLVASSSIHAQGPVATSNETSAQGGISISKIIAAVANKTGKKIIVDPRVRAQVILVGQDPATLSYPGFLSILEMNYFTAVEWGGYVRVIPIPDVRSKPIPMATGTDNFPDALFVSKVIPVRNVPAIALLQALRPLLPQYAHVGVIACSNVLVVVDSFANIKRLEALIQSIDIGEPFKPEKCAEKS